MELFSSANILLAHGKFWGFQRLMMFHIGTYSQRLAASKRKHFLRDMKTISNVDASDMTSWAL